MLLDVTMPGPDGSQVLARLRAMDPTIAVVMLTGNGDERWRARSCARAPSTTSRSRSSSRCWRRVMATAVAVGRRGSPRRLLY